MSLNSPGSTSQYSDATINSNTRAAQSYLEVATGRWFVDRPATVWATTSMLRAVVYIPGFRSFTSVTWGGATLSVVIPPSTTGGSVWPLQDPLATGIYTALQFRPFRADQSLPWWHADPNWWDMNLDSPFYPGNYGGGYAFTSMPNDLVVVGNGGYDNATVGATPDAVLHAVKVLSAFFTMRPASLLADTALTPAGGVLSYSDMPHEVVQFIRGWKI